MNRKKIVVLLVLLAIVTITCSCPGSLNLTGKSTPQPEVDQEFGEMLSKTGAANATQLAGIFSALATSEPMLPDLEEPEMNIEPGQQGVSSVEPISALEGLDEAMKKAEEWNDDAVLYRVEACVSPWCEGSEITAEGEAGFWTYVFFLGSTQTDEDLSQSFRVVVGADGVDKFEPRTDYRTPIIGSAEDWAVDSGEAIQIAEKNSGTQFRGWYPDAHVEMLLTMEGPYSETDPQKTAANVRWEVTYRNEDWTATRTIKIDAKTGIVIYLDTAYPAEAEEWPRLTAIQGYDQARTLAEKWSAGSALHEVAIPYDIMLDVPSLTEKGEAIAWKYVFYSTKGSNVEDQVVALSIEVSSRGIEAFEETIAYMFAEKMGEAAAWQIDSDRALELAETNGGSNFRQKNNGTTIDAVLSFEGYYAEMASENLLWEIRYQNADYSELKTWRIDASTGDVISME